MSRIRSGIGHPVSRFVEIVPELTKIAKLDRLLVKEQPKRKVVLGPRLKYDPLTLQSPTSGAAQMQIESCGIPTKSGASPRTPGPTPPPQSPPNREQSSNSTLQTNTKSTCGTIWGDLAPLVCLSKPIHPTRVLTHTARRSVSPPTTCHRPASHNPSEARCATRTAEAATAISAKPLRHDRVKKNGPRLACHMYRYMHMYIPTSMYEHTYIYTQKNETQRNRHRRRHVQI